MNNQDLAEFTVGMQDISGIADKILQTTEDGEIYDVDELHGVMVLASYLIGEPLPTTLALATTPTDIKRTLRDLILLRSNEERKKLMEAFNSNLKEMEKADIIRITTGVRCMILNVMMGKNGEKFCNPFNTPIKDWDKNGNQQTYNIIQYFNPKTGKTISEADYNRLPQGDKVLFEMKRFYTFADKGGHMITVRQDDLPYLEVLAEKDIEEHPEMIMHYIINTGKECSELPHGGATYMLRHAIARVMASKKYLEFQEGGVLYDAVCAGTIKNPWHAGIAIILTLLKADPAKLAEQTDERLNFYLDMIEQVCINTADIPDETLNSYRNSDGSFLPGVNSEGEIIKNGSTNAGQKRAYLHKIGEILLKQLHEGLKNRDDLWSNPTMVRLQSICLETFNRKA